MLTEWLSQSLQFFGVGLSEGDHSFLGAVLDHARVDVRKREDVVKLKISKF